MQIGIFGLVTIIFIFAKLFNIITWSWWLVFSPLFIGFLLLVFTLLGVGVLAYFSQK